MRNLLSLKSSCGIGLACAGCLVGFLTTIAPTSPNSASDLDRNCRLAITDAPDDGLVPVHGGTLRLGSGGIYREEGPVVSVRVDDFWISSHDVTNEQFQRFVDATGYLTVAERGPAVASSNPTPALTGDRGGAVFRQPLLMLDPQMLRWWAFVPGADWRHPEGSPSGLARRAAHPVVQVAFADAEAFANWAGMELPTEAQWEYAARGGVDDQIYPWGAELNPQHRHMANTWQGQFPFHDSGADGFKGTSPVGCYPANRFGLYDMVGNVWQWTRDPYFPDHGHLSSSAQDRSTVPSRDPDNPDIPSRVIKGGSFLCAPNLCARYRPAARQPHEEALGTNHLGFRVVQNHVDSSRAGVTTDADPLTR